jgi:hypothetical protein
MIFSAILPGIWFTTWTGDAEGAAFLGRSSIELWTTAWHLIGCSLLSHAHIDIPDKRSHAERGARWGWSLGGSCYCCDGGADED